MSMLTRCPACSTSFRITTDQLVSRQGKVRCGRCQHVFSALGSLVHTRDSAHPPSDQIAPLNANSQLLPVDSDSRLSPLELNSQLIAPDSPSLPIEEIVIGDAGPASMPGEEPDTPPVARPLRELARAAEEEEAQEEISSRRRVAWLSLAGVLLAVLGLLGQGAYFYRDQLALWQPETKPWLQEMCLRLACEIKTPLDPQAISIESSTLEADQNDRTLLQLGAILRNRSLLPQNLPYLELTLLDAQEAPLARRVIRPEEYGGRANVGQPQLGADSEYQVRMAIDASALKANGYRLYAFYP